MHDSEPDTYQPINKQEEFCKLLKKIGVDAETKLIGVIEQEKGDYFSKHFVNTPAMVTNHGIVQIKGSNIDLVQIIQKG
jgi:hypothetical protein